MQAQPVIKQGLLKQLLALLVFAIIGGMFAMPIFTTNGEIAGRSKFIFFFLILCRLGWQTYKRTFRFRDYFIYFAVFIGFYLCLDHYADA